MLFAGVAEGAPLLWSQILATEVLSVQVYDRDMLGDELLGVMEFDIGARLRELPLSSREATWQEAFPLQKVGPECQHPKPCR